MNRYELLQEENERFWESLDVQAKALNTQDFAALAEEEVEELMLDALTT